MIFSVFYVSWHVHRVFLLRLFTCLSFCIMPVVTRSQTKLHEESRVLSSNPPDHSTSPVPKSLTSLLSSFHPTSPTIESLDDCSCTVASISQFAVRSDHTVSASPSELIASTSLIDERLNPICIPSHHHDYCLECSTPTSLASTAPNLKFQNSSENIKFQILASSELDVLDVSQSLVIHSHNLEFQNTFTMDDDDADVVFDAGAKAHAVTHQAMMDMDTLFMAIKSHLKDTTQQLSGDFQRVIDGNARFKQEMCGELDEMRQFLSDQKRLLGIQSSPSSSSGTNAPSITPSVQVSSTSTVPSNSSMSVTSGQANQDVQSQLMVMLSESFSKLSTALSEKSDPKSDWPKFSGDVKKFRSWYLAIIAQLSLPPWQEFYDTTHHDIHPSTTNAVLNGKLYSKLLLALDGVALQSTVSKK